MEQLYREQRALGVEYIRFPTLVGKVGHTRQLVDISDKATSEPFLLPRRLITLAIYALATL